MTLTFESIPEGKSWENVSGAPFNMAICLWQLIPRNGQAAGGDSVEVTYSIEVQCAHALIFDIIIIKLIWT